MKLIEYITKTSEDRRSWERSQLSKLVQEAVSLSFEKPISSLAFTNYQVHGDLIKGIKDYLSLEEGISLDQGLRLKQIQDLAVQEQLRLREWFPEIGVHPFYRE